MTPNQKETLKTLSCILYCDPTAVLSITGNQYSVSHSTGSASGHTKHLPPGWATEITAGTIRAYVAGSISPG